MVETDLDVSVLDYNAAVHFAGMWMFRFWRAAIISDKLSEATRITDYVGSLQGQGRAFTFLNIPRAEKREMTVGGLDVWKVLKEAQDDWGRMVKDEFKKRQTAQNPEPDDRQAKMTRSSRLANLVKNVKSRTYARHFGAMSSFARMKKGIRKYGVRFVHAWANFTMSTFYEPRFFAWTWKKFINSTGRFCVVMSMTPADRKKFRANRRWSATTRELLAHHAAKTRWSRLVSRLGQNSWIAQVFGRLVRDPSILKKLRFEWRDRWQRLSAACLAKHRRRPTVLARPIPIRCTAVFHELALRAALQCRWRDLCDAYRAMQTESIQVD